MFSTSQSANAVAYEICSLTSAMLVASQYRIYGLNMYSKSVACLGMAESQVELHAYTERHTLKHCTCTQQWMLVSQC